MVIPFGCIYSTIDFFGKVGIDIVMMSSEEVTIQDYEHNQDRTYAKILLTEEGKKYLVREFSNVYDLDFAKFIREKLKD